MITSGEIPNEVYDKYLSKTPIGFMNETDLYDFLKGKKYVKKNDHEEKSLDDKN